MDVIGAAARRSAHGRHAFVRPANIEGGPAFSELILNDDTGQFESQRIQSVGAARDVDPSARKSVAHGADERGAKSNRVINRHRVIAPIVGIYVAITPDAEVGHPRE